MTLPALVHHRHKTVIESRLKKFYSAMNQAIMLAENEHGDKKDWVIADTDEFWNIYLKKHLHYTNVEDFFVKSKKEKIVYFTDGSAARIDIYYAENDDGEVTWQTSGGHFYFCPEAKNCRPEHFDKKNIGMKIFAFGFWPNENTKGSSFNHHKNKGVEQYMAWWNGNEQDLYDNKNYGCNINAHRVYCTAIIQRNGWHIPKDYPLHY